MCVGKWYRSFENGEKIPDLVRGVVFYRGVIYSLLADRFREATERKNVCPDQPATTSRSSLFTSLFF